VSRPFRRLLLLGVVTIALHNLEEALTLPQWLEARLPVALEQLSLPPLQPPSRGVLLRGLALVTLLPALVLAAGCWSRAAAQASLVVVAIYFWNALVPHVAGALLLREYVPGVLSAALLTIPYAAALFRRAVREGVISRVGAVLALLLAAVLYPLGMLALWVPRARPA
jgi:hypothetical protein